MLMRLSLRGGSRCFPSDTLTESQGLVAGLEVGFLGLEQLAAFGVLLAVVAPRCSESFFPCLCSQAGYEGFVGVLRNAAVGWLRAHVVAAQMGWGLKSTIAMLEVYSHHRVGALEAIDAAFEKTVDTAGGGE